MEFVAGLIVGFIIILFDHSGGKKKRTRMQYTSGQVATVQPSAPPSSIAPAPATSPCGCSGASRAAYGESNSIDRPLGPPPAETAPAQPQGFSTGHY